jgi:hypothetical protein
MVEDMRHAEIRLKQSRHVHHVQSVLGICYGKTRTVFHEGGYLKLVGQNFWTFIGEDRKLYINIIEPIGYHAREHNEQYTNEKNAITNVLTRNFIEKYCDEGGKIKWEEVVKANSGNFDLDRVL